MKRALIKAGHTCCWIIGFLTLAHLSHANSIQLIAPGASWKYLDDGSDQGTAWKEINFSDTSWTTGAAQLGYGDGDEATTLSYGGNATNKYITTYFRHTFNVADPSLYKNLMVNILRDDGAVVYINGREILRTNLPVYSGINYLTTATTAVGGSDEDTFYPFEIAGFHFNQGTNVIAVEIHQANSSSSDISFDLSLDANDDPISVNVARGPYLQTETPGSMIIKWRTDKITASKVNIGASPNILSYPVIDSAYSTEHEVLLTGLAPSSLYYYSIDYPGSGAALLGGSVDFHFKTSPPAGSNPPIKVWALGDCGTATSAQQAVRDAYLGYDSTNTDLVLLLGDNAYNNGTDPEYQQAIFDIYGETMKQSVFWSCPGNHDMTSASSSTQSGPYYNIFSFPKNAEAGGLPSGTEAYYSFDYGPVHFISLDSDDSPRNTGGSMLTWLEDDLNNTLQHWIIAFWHHPPYTKGSHNSDDAADSGGRMKDMRENALPILEAAGVDLVLTGHSHSYERSFMLKGHYDTSGTLQSSMILDHGSGNAAIDSAYHKTISGADAGSGAVYVVAGSSGKTGGVSQHPVMYTWQNTLGSVALNIEDSVLTAQFITNAGTVSDEFSIVKPLPKVISLDIKAFLGGAYDPDSGLMDDALRTSASLPFTEPYAALGFTQVGPGGGETAESYVFNTQGTNAIVDWVLVELRYKNDATIVEATRSALIQRDGDIVDEDGISALNFDGVAPDDYFIAIRHRNHLGVMTASPHFLGFAENTFDFTDSTLATYGSDAQQTVAGKRVMWSGNTNPDRYLKYSGADNDRDAILVSIGGIVPTNVVFGYHNEDVNMDGVVKYSGAFNDRDIILVNLGGIIPTATKGEQLP